MKLIAFCIAINIALVFSLGSNLKTNHRSKNTFRHRMKSRSHSKKYSENLVKASGNEGNEEQAPDVVPEPRVHGNYFDSGSYKTVCWLSKNGIPDVSALIFVSTIYWTESYIYFRKTLTLNEFGDEGALLEEKVFLFAPDSHDAFLPYYFFVDGVIKVDPVYDAFQVQTVDPKLYPLFEFTRGGNSALHMALISSNDQENMNFILDGMNEKVKNAYLLYNQRVKLIKESITEINAIKEEITQTKRELETKMRDDMFEYYLAKAKIIKSTLSVGLADILEEIETQENTKEVAARKFCDNLYLNGDFPFFRALMGDEWTKVGGDYDTANDRSEGHVSRTETSHETSQGTNQDTTKQQE